ncbi:MAG: hypothetical protein AAF485_10100 [Chloroflexota bacterium]
MARKKKTTTYKITRAVEYDGQRHEAGETGVTLQGWPKSSVVAWLASGVIVDESEVTDEPTG